MVCATQKSMRHACVLLRVGLREHPPHHTTICRSTAPSTHKPMLAKGDMAWRSSRNVLSAGRAVSAQHTTSSSKTALLRATAKRHRSSMASAAAAAGECDSQFCSAENSFTLTGILTLLCTGASPGATAPTSSTDQPRVCILGGGFGGLYTAVKLQLLMWPKGKKPQVSRGAAHTAGSSPLQPCQ